MDRFETQMKYEKQFSSLIRSPVPLVPRITLSLVNHDSFWSSWEELLPWAEIWRSPFLKRNSNSQCRPWDCDGNFEWNLTSRLYRASKASIKATHSIQRSDSTLKSVLKLIVHVTERVSLSFHGSLRYTKGLNQYQTQATALQALRFQSHSTKHDEVGFCKSSGLSLHSK